MNRNHSLSGSNFRNLNEEDLFQEYRRPGPLTELCRNEQWYECNPLVPQVVTCKSQCSLRSDSTGYGSYHGGGGSAFDHQTNNNNNNNSLCGTMSSNSSNEFPLCDKESADYYCASASSSDSSGISLDPKDPEASIDDFFRTPEFFEIEPNNFSQSSLNSNGTLDNVSYRRTGLEPPILDEVQPTPELHRKDMADMAKNVLHLINNMKIESPDFDDVIASTSRPMLECIPEEHIYEEINYDSNGLNLEGVQPPPLPVRNYNLKLVRFKSEPRLYPDTQASACRFYGVDETVATPSLMRLKRKIPSNHVFPPQFDTTRCFSYDTLPTNHTDFGTRSMDRPYRPQNVSNNHVRDIFEPSRMTVSPSGSMIFDNNRGPTQFSYSPGRGRTPPSNSTLKQWWLLKGNKRTATRV